MPRPPALAVRDLFLPHLDRPAEAPALLGPDGAPVATTYGLTFREYVNEVHRKYRWYRHCEVAAEVLQAVADGELRRVMFFEPPRHGKSEEVTKLFPGYYVRRHPERTVGLCAYGDTLATTFSRAARDFYLRSGGLLRGDTTSVHEWLTTEGGGLWSAGVGGAITGRGFHLGIIDDPIKNSEESFSDTILAKQREWYDSTFYTREEPEGAIIVVQTRWNEADLSGYLLEKEDEDPEHWHIVNFAAIKEAAPVQVPVTCTLEPDWRQPGEALCPERYPLPKLEKRMRRLGGPTGYFWLALFQQRPASLEGNIFKRNWLHFYTPDMVAGLTFQMEAISVDCAFKDEEESKTGDVDYVVGQVWARHGPNFYFLDQRRDRINFVETLQMILDLKKDWPRTRAVYVEDKANGTAILSVLRKRIPGMIPVTPEGGKTARAFAVQAYWQAGNVWLPDPTKIDAPWVADFIDELMRFPRGKNDDQVDAMTQMLAQIGIHQSVAPDPTAEEYVEAFGEAALKHEYQQGHRVRSIGRGSLGGQRRPPGLIDPNFGEL